MIHRIQIISATLLFVLASPIQCIAAPRGVIFSEGSKPSRIVYVAEFLNVQDRTNRINSPSNDQSDDDLKKQLKVEMRVVVVYENLNAPESTDMTVEFMCFREKFRVTSAHTMIRDGSERFPTQDWQSYGNAKSAWPMVASEIACKNETVKIAASQVEASKGGQDFNALEKLGIFYIGEPDRLETVDTVWQTFLMDGKRPKYASRQLSDAEVAAYHKIIDETVASAKQSNEASMALANAELGKMKSEKEFKKEIARNSSKHGKQLGWLLGQNEQAIVRVAGKPFNLHVDDGVRYLIYYNEYEIAGAGYVLDNNGNYISTSTTVTCEVEIEMKKGGSSREYRAVDYRLTANNGGCRDLGWFSK